jgi:hypothetical protein
MARERVECQLLADERGKTIDRPPQIGRAGRQIDPHGWRECQHAVRKTFNHAAQQVRRGAGVNPNAIAASQDDLQITTAEIGARHDMNGAPASRVSIAVLDVAAAPPSSTAPASNTRSTASRRVLQQTPERSHRSVAIDGRAPASAVVDPLVPASRSPSAPESLQASVMKRRRSSNAYELATILRVWE